MSSFIRPEARAKLWQWREFLVGLGAAGFGAGMVLGPGGMTGIVGGAVLVVGMAVTAFGWQRAQVRDSNAGGGLGSVDVDEGQITYFGPLTGGTVALQDMTEVALIRAGQTPHWRLSASGSEPLHIPVDAAGADALFDAFSILPGLSASRIVQAMKAPGEADIVLWRAGVPERPRLG